MLFRVEFRPSFGNHTLYTAAYARAAYGGTDGNGNSPVQQAPAQDQDVRASCF